MKRTLCFLLLLLTTAANAGPIFGWISGKKSDDSKLYAADPKQIRAANCLRWEPLTIDEMLRELESPRESLGINRVINGISFENESHENLNAFYRLTTMFKDNYRPLSSKQFVSSCKTVICAMNEIFGETGVQLLFMHRKYGFNGSHLTGDNYSAWKKKELDIVLLTLSDYPSKILPLYEDRALKHAPRTDGPAEVNANSTILVYPNWDKLSVEEQRSTILHEVAHVLGGVSKIDASNKWLSFAGWYYNKERKEYVTMRKDSIVSWYGEWSPFEEFAESAIAYRYNPNRLKTMDQAKYNFIKKYVFDDVEYTSQESCEKPQRFSQSYIETLVPIAKILEPSDLDIMAIARKCTPGILWELIGNGSADYSRPFHEKCFAKALQEVARIDLMKRAGTRDPDFLAPILRNTSVTIENKEKILKEAKALSLSNVRVALEKLSVNKEVCDDGTAFLHIYEDMGNLGMGDDPIVEEELVKLKKLVCDEKKKDSKNFKTRMVK